MKNLILCTILFVCAWGLAPQFAQATTKTSSTLSHQSDEISVQLALKILYSARPGMEADMDQEISNGFLVSRYNRGMLTITEVGQSNGGGQTYMVTLGSCNIIVTIGSI